MFKSNKESFFERLAPGLDDSDNDKHHSGKEAGDKGNYRPEEIEQHFVKEGQIHKEFDHHTKKSNSYKGADFI